MDYILEKGEGRDNFVRFWRLVAEAVKDHPSAFAAELMNEPMSIKRWNMYETWRACAESINSVIPDMSVSLSDVGEGSFIPDWVVRFIGGGVAIKHDTVEWIKRQNTLFYSWHYYGNPKTVEQALKNTKAIMKDWNMPSFMTEFDGCDAWN